ncbi:MAG: LLM class F420-dependent oxidoreductase [Chloroflexi bacterium]|nr:LLM class F420-dependent oxidoreductase [Chloroflexota bacterium]
MRISLFPGSVPGELSSLSEIIIQGLEAERDGFDGFWVPHLSNRGFDALTVISLIGLQTESIELGTAVVPTYPRHPTAMAQQAMTSQVACQGRLVLGIGPSHQGNVEDAWGLSYERPAHHVREYLSILTPLVRDGKARFSGDMYQVDTQIDVPETTLFPVLVSALAPVMLRIAGELADGTITWMAGIGAIEKHIVPRISKAARDAGRNAPRICVGLPICVTDDRDAAFEDAANRFRRYGTLVNYRRILNVESVDGPADVAVIGNEKEVEEQLTRFADAGVTDFLASVYPVGDDSEVSSRRTRDLLSSLVGKL